MILERYPQILVLFLSNASYHHCCCWFGHGFPTFGVMALRCYSIFPPPQGVERLLKVRPLVRRSPLETHGAKRQRRSGWGGVGVGLGWGGVGVGHSATSPPPPPPKASHEVARSQGPQKRPPQLLHRSSPPPKASHGVARTKSPQKITLTVFAWNCVCGGTCVRSCVRVCVCACVCACLRVLGCVRSQRCDNMLGCLLGAGASNQLQGVVLCSVEKLGTLLDLCVSSLRRGHANLLCIVPILTDDPRRESEIFVLGQMLCIAIAAYLRRPPRSPHFVVYTYKHDTNKLSINRVPSK